MTEEFSKDLLSAYFDEELTLDERAQVERKLHAEPILREELEQLSQVSQLLGNLQKELAPEDLHPSIFQQIERELLLNSKQSPQLTTSQTATPQRKDTRLLTGILLMTACGILVALRFLVFAPGVKPLPVETDVRENGNIAELKTEIKKKPADTIAKKENNSNAAIVAIKRIPRTKKKTIPVPLQWDEIIASLDYTNNKTAVIEFDAKDDKELLKKIQQVLTKGNMLLADNSPQPKMNTTGIKSIYFEGTADQLKETLKKLTTESWWKKPTLRESIKPQSVQLAEDNSKQPKQEGADIRSFSPTKKITLSQKIAQSRQKMQVKKKENSGFSIQSVKKTPKPKPFQLPVQIDKQSWEKMQLKPISPQNKTKTAKRFTKMLRVLIVIKKK